VPTGPFNDALGGPLISSSTLGAYTTNQWYFDPCALIDDNGQPYLYFGGQSPPNARVVLLNTNMTSISGAAMPTGATNFFEASYLHKRNGIYYYTYSSLPPSVILCMTNANPTNGFSFQGTVLAAPVNFGQNNQSSFFTYKGNWYCAYPNRYLASQNGIPP
jgi:arabinoxylan arabinofuranohydrolase